MAYPKIYNVGRAHSPRPDCSCCKPNIFGTAKVHRYVRRRDKRALAILIED